MFIAFLVIIIASAIFWLVFFKLRLLRLTPGWGLIFGFSYSTSCWCSSSG